MPHALPTIRYLLLTLHIRSNTIINSYRILVKICQLIFFLIFFLALGFLVTFFRFLVILSRSTYSRFGFLLVSHFLPHKELYVHHKGHWGDEFGFSFLPSIKDCVFCYFHVFIWYKFHVSYILCSHSFTLKFSSLSRLQFL